MKASQIKGPNQKGFTLVELMIVVAIIGILVAIAIPNLLDAIDRARQKATVGDLHSWGNGISAFHVDKNAFPTPGSTLDDINPVLAQIVPYSVNKLPPQDHWNNNFLYESDEVGTYTVASAGKNGVKEYPAFGCTPVNWYQNNYGCDIVLNDGVFIYAPI